MRTRHISNKAAFSLVELIISLGLAGVCLGGVISGYFTVMRRTEFAAYSAAAQAAAGQRMEQIRAAKWDPYAAPVIDQVVATNFGIDTVPLERLSSTGKGVIATNFVTISNVSARLKFVRVDTVWNSNGRRLFTNTIATYRAPDQ